MIFGIEQLWGQLKEIAENLSQLWFSWSRWVPQLCVLWQDDPCRAVNLTQPTVLWLFDLWLFIFHSLSLFFCASLSLFGFFVLYKLPQKDKAGLISWLLSKCYPICADLYLRGENVFIYYMLTCLLQAWEQPNGFIRQKKKMPGVFTFQTNSWNFRSG